MIWCAARADADKENWIVSFIPFSLHTTVGNEIRGYYKRLHVQQNQTEGKGYVKQNKTIK